MKAMWKFTLDVAAGVNTLKVPAGAEFKHAHVHADNPGRVDVWALVNPQAGTVSRQLLVLATGDAWTEHPPTEHVATVVHDRSGLVWHVVEVMFT